MTTSKQVEKLLNRRIVEHFLTLDNYGEFVHPIQTDEDLDRFIQAAYGVSLPNESHTPGHRTPFEFVADLFFERVKNALAFANRSGGKTFATAILNHLDMVFKPGCEITSAGAVKDQAEKCYRYFREFCDMDWFVVFSTKYQQVTGKPLYVERDSIQSRTVLGNDSRLELITASEKGLRGPHPHKSRLDEIDEIPWNLVQMGLSMSQSSYGIRGQNVFLSTRQYAEGTMNRMVSEAPQRGIEVYEWNIYETLERCNRRCKGDPEHGDCPIYVFCRGKAHQCSDRGFYTIDDFIDKVRVLDRETFETEWLNERPAKEKLVYHMFGSRHIMTPEKLMRYCGYAYPQLTWERVCGIDFGSSPGHPFVYLKFLQVPNKHAWLLFYEYVAEQKLLKDHALAIRTSPFYLPSDRIYADWAAQERLELKAHGVRTKSATKGHGSVLVGINHICELLNGYPPDEEPMLYVWHECVYTIEEWGKYSWPVRADGQANKSGNPEKKNDHCSDAARMALFSDKRQGSGPKYRGRSVRWA